MILSHRISFSCPTLTFLALSAAKCASTLVDHDDLVRPLSHCFPHLLF